MMIDHDVFGMDGVETIVSGSRLGIHLSDCCKFLQVRQYVEMFPFRGQVFEHSLVFSASNQTAIHKTAGYAPGFPEQSSQCLAGSQRIRVGIVMGQE